VYDEPAEKSFMSARTFVDTNVLIYAHDLDAGRKHERANAVLRELWSQRAGVVSTQVLQEFYVNVTRKISAPLPRELARVVVETYATWCMGISSADIAAAFRIEDQARIAFWDALLISTAVRSGAQRIVSEDFNVGQHIAGIVIENPFADVC
jgi:predicted nucleic acid-binding protein